MAERLVMAQRTEYGIFKVIIPDDVTPTMQVVQEALNDPKTEHIALMVGEQRPTPWLPTSMEDL